MTAPVQRHPLAAQGAEALLARIRAGEWGLGHRLPGETTLAAQLGVGRSTVREAVRELSGKGVLDSRQGVGVFVTALDVTEDWDAVLRRTSVTSVLEARIAIEVEAAALAAERRTPNDLRAVRRALAGRAVTGRSVEDHVDADMAFHRCVIVAAHNDLLIELFDSFVPRVRTSMVDMMRTRPPASPEADHAAHEALTEAIAGRDPQGAAELSRAHLTGLKEVYK
ncbi:FadR/GntR family transcriptional regulator [Actinocorallia sp. A-T 12471]|uniref:FadR/GntR family transcriptional regulator n=1 Tax=Actinocorallia sp. A-T 12471 TaxID=3089813 RepID=UPI0029D2B61E|nr:FCD domain-containing protein [Actinocorallia sp. A-T 12471]MDX6742183.1 FCD domain-containing protein [Actinocorallia sp. A-T 12471]